MNLLYISSIKGAPWAGPTYSVPNQIKAQAKIDNVFWYNIYDGSHPEWVSSKWNKLSYYSDLRNHPKADVSLLPLPFNKPDLIIVEQFYCFAKLKFPRDLVKGSIPYIIVPRGELTVSAQKRNFIKKHIFNMFFYHKFAQNAIAIQYLTEQEKIDSGEKWNKNSIVTPNGINPPIKTKKIFSKDQIKAVVIGRIEPYQKGLDILIDACEKCKEMMTMVHMTIDIYGPDWANQLQKMKVLVEQKGLGKIISFHNAIYGVEKEQVLLDADVFIIPSRFEGHPMSLIEALSYGIPSIVTTGANMRQEIENFNAGWGADSSTEGLVNAISQMIRDQNNFKEKSNNAKILAHNYSWDVLACKSHEIYKGLCKK